MKWIVFFILFFLMAANGFAQDIHFSQYGRSYLNLNPALTGSFNANYRLNANYKNQWSSISEPYRTFAFGAEAKSPIKKIKPIHLGLNFYNDDAGLGGLNTTKGLLSIAYRSGVNYDSTLIVKGGIQGGFISRSVDFNKFSFDQQYNGGRYNQNLSNGENFERNSYLNPTLNLGAALTYRLSRVAYIEGGLGLFNVLGNNQSFQGVKVPLKLRTTAFARADFEVANGIDIIPSMLFSFQGNYNEILFGSSVRYRVNGRNNFRNENIYLGLWYRNQDAIIASIAFDYKVWQIGMSYDINTSSLTNATNNKGGFELAITYLIRTFSPNIKRYNQCPDFL